MRCIIFVNGEFHHPDAARSLIRPDDYVIAVNGGTVHALRIGVMPDVIIGDLDSLGEAEHVRLRDANTTIQRFSSRKDETDLELGLRHALERGATEILLLAAIGGRMDQSLANLLLLTLPELQGVAVRIVEGRQRAFLIRDYAVIHGNPGDMVSILPLSGDAIGVRNTGFEWPLHGETLPLGTSRGVSNVMRERKAEIRVQKGMMVCVVTRQEV